MNFSSQASRSRDSGRQVLGGVVDLPAGMKRIQDIIDGCINVGLLVNVMGVVTDVREPIPTNRTDYKMTLKLVDLSTQTSGQSVEVSIFWPKEHMPTVEYNDVILLHQFKVQNYHAFGLITNRNSDILVYSAQLIPRPPRDAEVALKGRKNVRKKTATAQEHAYVSDLAQGLDRTYLPDEHTFQARAAQSLNVKSKFRLLKDVKVDGGAENGVFVDLIVRVVREPYDMGDKITLWVSDYTENDAFFHHMFNGDASTSTTVDSEAGWPGPLGKRSLQVTAWDPHAELIRNEVHFGSWLRLRNVHITYGSNSANLEGKLRGDQNESYGGKLLVDLLFLDNDYHKSIPEWKDAISRRADYDKQAKKQLKQLRGANGNISEDDSSNNKKRKADGALNAKERRKAERAVKRQAVEQKEQRKLESLDLNPNVKCEHGDQEFSLLSDLYKQYKQHTEIITVDGREINHTNSFVNVNCRCAVRVVDFEPHDLRNFAKCRVWKETDMLSDFSGESSDDSEDEQDPSSSDQDPASSVQDPNRKWEWCFALLLEDASQPDKTPIPTRDRAWVMVDNESAQMLTNLDADNLRSNHERHSQLANQMSILWGDLEEKKRARRDAAKQRADEAVAARPKGGKLAKPNLNSSDDEAEDALQKENGEQAPPPMSQTIRNKPFACCIKQYAVKEPAAEGELDDAGQGKKWLRMFGLFGTKISGL